MFARFSHLVLESSSGFRAPTSSNHLSFLKILLSGVFTIGLFISLAGCDPIELEATHTGFDDDTVEIMIRDLGELTPKEFQNWRDRIDVEQALRLPAKSCEGDCRFALLTVYVENAGKSAFAPPVVRIDAPKGRPARGALAFGVNEISPGRKGRLRWLVELWPEEQKLTANISSSVFFAVQKTEPRQKDADTDAKRPTVVNVSGSALSQKSDEAALPTKDSEKK